MKPIQTFIINVEKRIERKQHSLEQFNNKPEFDVKIIKAVENKNGAVGLWRTIVHIIEHLTPDETDYILICEDDHQFTKEYNRSKLISDIEEAKRNGADILSGGVSWFGEALQLSSNLFWLHQFTGLQFTIIFKNFFRKILETEFKDHDITDRKIATLTDNKFLMYPFISIQKEFGYSDVTAKNNTKGYVNKLFKDASIVLHKLAKIRGYYQEVPEDHIAIEEEYENITIPTYIINRSDRPEQLQHISQQFEHRNEFEVRIIEACQHTNKARDLWNSILKVIHSAIQNDDDVIIICTADHEFTGNYRKAYLLKNIIEAHQQGLNLLLGGIGGFEQAVPVTKNRLWTDTFQRAQFMVIYKPFFQNILDEPFSDNDTADAKFSEMTSNKMVLYPFISVQKDFGYSGIANSDHEPGRKIPEHFEDSNLRLNTLTNADQKYKAMDIQMSNKTLMEHPGL
ncbi:hypothetical protein HQN84_18460 [Pedobacter steynii]|nr:hypothetical protein [Pedobacter steynii]NQX40838.1 hypothetical protein [Pedobacter steynii]